MINASSKFLRRFSCCRSCVDPKIPKTKADWHYGPTAESTARLEIDKVVLLILVRRSSPEFFNLSLIQNRMLVSRGPVRRVVS